MVLGLTWINLYLHAKACSRSIWEGRTALYEEIIAVLDLLLVHEILYELLAFGSITINNSLCGGLL